jgi:hypothetical protein
MSKVKLNIGSGERNALPGYIPIDEKLGMPAYPLPFANATVDEVYASHVLEHFGHREVAAVLAEWVRVLRPGGLCRLAVPDYHKCVERGDAYGLMSLMGGQVDALDYHKCCFDEASLTALMRHVGLVDIKPFESFANDCSASPVSLNLVGRRPSMLAIQSMPRLAFTANMMSLASLREMLGVDVQVNIGWHWAMAMQRELEKRVDDFDYIITCDYDSVLAAETVPALLTLLNDNDAIDAICAVQVKREADTPLFVPLNDDGTRVTDETFSVPQEKQTQRIAWGHFGCTVFRASSLRRLERPWLWDQPDPDGGWGDKRVDADIYFWNKLNAAGMQAHVALHVPVGHAQQLVTWPDQQLKPIHQYVNDWLATRRPPVGARS